jgi:type I restriction enzyme S subunit
MRLLLDEIPTGWELRNLGGVDGLAPACEFLDHMRVPVNSTERAKRHGPYPYYGANGLQGQIDNFLFDEPLVLLAEDGGFFFDGERPVSYRVDGKCWVNNHAHVLRALPDVDRDWLHWVIAFQDLTHLIPEPIRPKLNQSNAKRIRVPVPPLAEQRRLVGRIEALTGRLAQARQARRAALTEAEAMLESAIKSAFHAVESDDDSADLPFDEAIVRLQSRGGKLRTSEYKEEGRLPIVDQGQKLICGYTNETERHFQGPLPVVIFGDHTRNVKFVDFDFAVGADGVVLMRSCERIEPKFLYYWLCSRELHQLGYSRHFKLLHEETIRFPNDQAAQEGITDKLDALAAKLDELRRLQQEVQAELAAFTPALLAKAFRGEL